MTTLKLELIGLWVILLAAFAMPGDTPTLMAGRWAFGILLAANAIQCLVFLPRLRAAPGPLGGQLLQTLIYGIFHIRTLKPA